MRLKDAHNIHACIVCAIAYTAFVQFGRRIQLIVASGRSTNTIYAFIETVMAACCAIFHFIAEQKIIIRIDDATIQFAFIVRRLTIFWHPFHIRIQSLDIEIVVVHIGALFFAKIQCIWWTILCVTWSVLDSRTSTIFATIWWCWWITFTWRWLYATTTCSSALIISTIDREKFVWRKKKCFAMNLRIWLTVSMDPNHRQFWPKPFDCVEHICHVDTNDSIDIQCHRPTACVAFDNLHYRFHTIDDHMVAATLLFY